MFAWHYLTIYHVAINMASLIMVKGSLLLDATIVASLAIFLGNARVSYMHKMPGPEVRAMVTKTMAIRAVVMVMVMAVGRLVVEPMPWIPMI